MDTNYLKKFNVFRTLCLQNASDCLKSADLLKDQGVNHIVFHLATTALEEIGKIFIGWYQLSNKEEWDSERINIPIDDHIKKIFWAVWWPSIGNEKITKENMDATNGMATKIHELRLFSLYTDLADTVSSASKIANEGANQMVSFVRARLDLAKMEGEVNENYYAENKEERNDFMQLTSDPVKRNFIFGELAQDKLIEFGDLGKWIEWVKDSLVKQQQNSESLVEQELARKLTDVEEEGKPKWNIKIKIYTPSHSIRVKTLNEFNKKFKEFILTKGKDNHTLFIEFILTDHFPIKGLWNEGWLLCQLFVASLSVGANGLFWWNIVVDRDKYYENITDLESKQILNVKVIDPLVFNWADAKLILQESHLETALFLNSYFMKHVGSKKFVPINMFLRGLAMFAKNDIHLRIEFETFMQFYLALRQALILNNYDPKENLKDYLHTQIPGMIRHKEEFNKVMDLGKAAFDHNIKENIITIAEVLQMKMYCGYYFLTLAARDLNKDDSLNLTVE